MTVNTYLLITILLFTILLFPLLRKAVSLLEIFVNKYIQQVNAASQEKMNTSQDHSNQENKTDISRTVLNLKLLAYERIILFIERMKPDSLIPRTLSSALNNKEYQLLLIQEIRKEFEYNLSQQLYLSENAWSITVSFKDSIITLINSSSADCNPAHPANELAKKVLEHYITSELKADQILKVVKQDIQ